MKKKPVLFTAVLAACLLLAAAGHTTATAETYSFVNGPLPTPVPEQEALQDEDAPSERTYYINNAGYSGIFLRRIDVTENDTLAEMAPEFLAEEVMPNEKVAYFEASDGGLWITVSSSEWITLEYGLSEEEISKTADNDYEEKTLSNKIAVWYTGDGSRTKVAIIESLYDVWYYNDNKVHLRGRLHTYKLLDSSYSAQVIYGNIINTDGSTSYTSGDKFKLTKNGESHYTNLNFVVSPSTYSFD